MTKLSFTIQPPLLVNQQVNDAGGNWQYVGANAVEESSGVAVNLVATKRDNSSGGVSFPASLLTATVMFPSQENDVSDHLTIQGLHDLTSNNETGSVSSASAGFSEYIGGRFLFDSAAGRLTVFSRE
ncbi:MAG TPA: hypothetical protein VH087_05955 [Thermoanaerobaculia bacterium]|nr:hypothetical protein [Thermoanaerobaculia bacterium]